MAIKRRALDPGSLGDREDGRMRRTQRCVEFDRGLYDPLPGLGLALRAFFKPVFLSHICPHEFRLHLCITILTDGGNQVFFHYPHLYHEMTRPMDARKPKVVGPHEGKAGFLGSIGVRFVIDGAEASDRFSLVEHPMSAHALAAPMHRHLREDEYSYVLEGSIGALLGDSVVIGKPGDLIFKPRNQWHTFWNAGDTPARILEIISPAGFERFFQELVDLGGVANAKPQALTELCARYELEMDPGSIPGLVDRFGVRFPGEPIQQIAA